MHTMKEKIYNLINRLDSSQEEKLLSILEKMVDKPYYVTEEEAKNNLKLMRAQAEASGKLGMSLDEINEEIRLAREERRKKKESALLT